jgi:hypothetical protein
LSLLIIDEAALIDEAEELWTSAQPTLSTGGNAIILSTPRGVGNWFHKMWTQAEENNPTGKETGKNNFHPIKLPWDLHPDRDLAWREREGAKQGSPKKAAQEFDCDFLASGDNVVELSIVEFYKKTYMSEPIRAEGMHNALWVWQEPDYTQPYIVCADVARGDGEDFSGCHVLNAATMEQCAEFKAQPGTKEYGHMLVSLATTYNQALLIIERENIGWATIQSVIDLGYPNLFYSSADLRYVDVQRQLTNKIDSQEKKMVPGFSTNINTRKLVIAHLEQYFREKAVIIHSKRTLSELETFIWKNGKAQAMDGYNDDLIMSLGIGLWVSATALRLRQEGIELTRATLGKANMTKSEEVPVYKQKAMERGQQTWSMPTRSPGFGHNGHNEDLTWLLG